MNNRKFVQFSCLRSAFISSAFIIGVLIPSPSPAKMAETLAPPRTLIAFMKPSAEQIAPARSAIKQVITKKRTAPQKLSGNDYIAVIQNHLEEIEQCYDQQLKNGTNGSGKLVVQWMIDSTGKSSQFTQEKNDLNSNEFFNCAVEAIGRWDFPKDRSVQFRYTFNLTQQNREIARTFKPDNTRFQKSTKSTRIDF